LPPLSIESEPGDATNFWIAARKRGAQHNAAAADPVDAGAEAM